MAKAKGDVQKLGAELFKAVEAFLEALKGLDRSYTWIPEDDLTPAAFANIEDAIDQAITDGTFAMESVERAQEILDEEEEWGGLDRGETAG